jgi:hypothetical protein
LDTTYADMVRGTGDMTTTPDSTPPGDGPNGATIDAADAAVGYRSILEPADTDELGADDPNVARCSADESADDPADLVGEEVPDDIGVQAALDDADRQRTPQGGA